MKIIFASSNQGKIAELSALFQNQGIDIISQSQLNIPDIEETGLSFIENAILKARHAAKISGLPAIADDSGLVVPALQGAPGIYSARYAGIPSNAAANIAKLLTEMQNLSGEDRQAFFHCSLVFLRYPHDPMPIICAGNWHGRILTSAVGTAGFGYDPVFFDPNQNCSAAEMNLTLKNQLSHRGQALKKLLEAIACMH